MDMYFAPEDVGDVDCWHDGHLEDSLIDRGIRSSTSTSSTMPRVQTTKTTKLVKAPEVLVICLQRFALERTVHGSTRKINDHVSFGTQLDISKYFSDTLFDGPLPGVFSLNAVIVHAGSSLHHGHYTAYVRSGSHSGWVYVDDHQVSNIDEAQVLEAQAYMVCAQPLRPRSTSWPGTSESRRVISASCTHDGMAHIASLLYPRQLVYSQDASNVTVTAAT